MCCRLFRFARGSAQRILLRGDLSEHLRVLTLLTIESLLQRFELLTRVIDLLVRAVFHGSRVFLERGAFGTQCVEFDALFFEL